jgi:hypothetical protein
MKHRDTQPGSDSARPRTTKARLVLAAATLGVLSLITGIISYEHALDVVRAVGNTGLVAYLVPLVPDLTIVAASQVLFEASAAAVKRPLIAWVALFVGIGWTIAMNVAAGWGHGDGAATIAGLVPVSFVLTFEALQLLFRRGRDSDFTRPVPAAHNAWEPPGNQEGREPREHLDGWIRDLMAGMTEREASDALGISRTRIRSAIPAPEPAEPETVLALNGTAASA